VLDHKVDARNVGKCRRVPRLIPVIRAGHADGRLTVGPERVAVRFALDQHGVAALVRLGEPVEAVETELGALLPAEAVVAVPAFVKTQAIADRPLVAVGIVIGDADHRLPRVDEV
jgi:hypothetical protein